MKSGDWLSKNEQWESILVCIATSSHSSNSCIFSKLLVLQKVEIVLVISALFGKTKKSIEIHKLVSNKMQHFFRIFAD